MTKTETKPSYTKMTARVTDLARGDLICLHWPWPVVEFQAYHLHHGSSRDEGRLTKVSYVPFSVLNGYGEVVNLGRMAHEYVEVLRPLEMDDNTAAALREDADE